MQTIGYRGYWIQIRFNSEPCKIQVLTPDHKLIPATTIRGAKSIIGRLISKTEQLEPETETITITQREET